MFVRPTDTTSKISRGLSIKPMIELDLLEKYVISIEKASD